MSIKKSIFSVLILFIVSNVLTTLWYMLTNDANYVAFRREEVNYIGLIINHLVFVVGFVYLFPFYIKTHNTLLRAFLYGIILAAIMFVPTGIVVRSIWNVDFNTIFFWNAIAHFIIGGILGVIIYLIFNYKNK